MPRDVTLSTHAAAGWCIRKRKRGDGPALFALFEDCLSEFPWRGSRAPYRRQLAADLMHNMVQIAEEPAAGLIGFSVTNTRAAYVSHIFVHRDWRLCGVGRDMLLIARASAGQPLRLDVDVQNLSARAAYDRLGWTETAGGGRNQIRLISP